MSGTDAQVRVTGDVRGQLVIGDHNVVVTAERSIVTVLQPGERPEPTRRKRIELLPRRTGALRGRESEIGEIRLAVAEEEPIQVHGGEGVGKSTLVRHVARMMAGRESGIVFLNGSGRDVDDIAQDIFESCYDSFAYRPSVIEMQRMMAGIGACFVIDDLDCPRSELTGLLDRAPDATFVLTSAEQTLWGSGRILPLRGLGRQDGRSLLGDALGRALTSAEADTADALWEATSGNPLALLRAAAASRPDGSGARLPSPSELPDILARVLDDLTAAERDVVSLLGATEGWMSTELIAVLVDEPSSLPQAADHLTALGITTACDDGLQLTQGAREALPEHLKLKAGQLADLAGRLTEWATSPGAQARRLSDDSRFVSAVIQATITTGKPRVGAQLAAEVAPSAASSLRMGPWRRILEHGLQAATASRDQRLIAYFTHEEGIRSLLTGKRVAAVAALTAAATIWSQLGEHTLAEATRQTQHLFGPTTSTPPTGHVPSGPHASASHPTDPTAGHAPTSHGSHSTAGHSPAPADPGPATGTSTASTSGSAHAGGSGAAKAGLGKVMSGLTGKLILGGGLAGLVASGVVFGLNGNAPETVPVHVKVTSAIIEVSLPGTREKGCRTGQGQTDCTTTVTPKKGESGPIEVRPNSPLPDGVHFVYWGCDQGPSASACTVRADQERTVCVTTTSPKDKAARTACTKLAGIGDEPDKQDPSKSPTAMSPVMVMTPGGYISEVSADFAGQPVCRSDTTSQNRADGNFLSCRFVVPTGTTLRLKATRRDRNPDLVDGDNSQVPIGFVGCDEQNDPYASPALATCTVRVNKGTVLCLEAPVGLRNMCSAYGTSDWPALPATPPPGFSPGPHYSDSYYTN
ncbi:hypothetical protein [Streptomyces neyagawaensis]|uniref:AAA+ ATPase domain-containing protein n=1 Tax=Streptomyces neyagawaensis TaxID=42238 RepID=A0ABV3B0Q0_9ACTN